MKYEETECKGCKTKEGSLFLLQPAEDGKDFWCDKCRSEEMKRRAEAKEIKQTKGHTGQKN